MKNKIKEIIKNPKLRSFIGVSLIVFGALLMLVPIVPGVWLVVVGLEFLGIRLLLKDRLKRRCKNYWFYERLCKMITVKTKD